MERIPTRQTKPYNRRKKRDVGKMNDGTMERFAIPVVESLPRPSMLVVESLPRPRNPEATVGPIRSREFGRISLGNNRFVVVCEYQGRLLVHIREFTDNGTPTKKGVCFDARRWASFRFYATFIDEYVATYASGETFDYKAHLGGKVYATVNSQFKCVNLRKYFVPKGGLEDVPTKLGIALRLGEWIRLRESMDDIHGLAPQLLLASRCSDAPDHADLSTFMNCAECNPFKDYIHAE